MMKMKSTELLETRILNGSRKTMTIPRESNISPRFWLNTLSIAAGAAGKVRQMVG